MTRNKPKLETYDRVVLGAGIFGLYSALHFAKQKLRVLVIEKENEPFQRASYVNQARIHSGYHYPRSLSTALKTAEYVKRFVTDYDFAVNKSLRQVYAIAKNFSYTNAEEFEKFCKHAHIRAEKIDPKEYFQDDVVESAYLTDEYGYDAIKMRDYLMSEIARFGTVSFSFGNSVQKVVREKEEFTLELKRDDFPLIRTPYVVNATYAGLNEVILKFGLTPIAMKYEYAELALCSVPPILHNVGLTVMDGPFFSLMPFGGSGLHSLSAVSYTPNKTSASPIDVPPSPPDSRFVEMRQLARKFLRDDIDMEYQKSMFATKAILTKAELDDARPTLIDVQEISPRFVSVMSGKLNTIFDLDNIL